MAINLVCFVGVIGAGKDYESKKLVKQGYKQINLADELRQLTWEILGWTPADVDDYEDFKAEDILCLGYPELTGREFLQNLGTALKTRHEGYWAKVWAERVNKVLATGQNICTSDIRYLDEVKEAIALHNSFSEAVNDFVQVKFIFCDYKSHRYNADDKHISEALAQQLLNEGFKDGEEIPHSYFKALYS